MAVRGPLLFFLLPPVVLRPLAAFRPLRALLSVLLIPLVSLGLWTATISSGTSRRSTTTPPPTRLVHDLEHLTFFVAGLLVWTQLVDPARHGRLRRPQRILFALGDAGVLAAARRRAALQLEPRYPRYATPPIGRSGSRR